MTALTQARARFTEATSKSRAIVRREDGGIDLPSTMVSILVIAAFLAAAALAVFVVIPWAQNNAAKQLVSQIATGQSSSYAMSADGNADPKYSTLAELKTQTLITGNVDAAKVKIKTWNVTSSATTAVTGGDATVPAPGSTFTPKAGTDAFVVTVQSDTGKVYYATNENPQPKDS